ncbi:MAG: hypothetical protein NTNFB02_07350 [Nitrospira sp.]
MRSLKQLLGFPSNPSYSSFRDPAMNIHCSEFEVDNWTISSFVVDTLVPVVGVHPFPLNELSLMVATVCRFKPDHIVEWGTHLGKSARVFYETARHFGLNVTVHSIDLPDPSAHQEHPGKRRGELVTGLSGVRLYQGDGLGVCREISARLSTTVPSVVFIDGDHQYESVMCDLTGVMACMPNAHILLHDTFFQSAESGYNIGPYRAIVDALAAAPRRYRVLSSQTGLPGMTLLYRLP